MSFIELSQFYKNFYELYSAGIDSATAAESLEQRATGHNKQVLKIVSQSLRKGRSLYTSFRAGQCVPVFDLPLVKAAEDSGRIVDVFKKISQKHLDTHEHIKKIRSSLIKPYFTFAVALMFPGITDLFSQKTTLAHYLRNSVGILVLVTTACYLIYNYWIQSYFDLMKARSLHQILTTIPFFKKLTSKIAYEKFASTLALMLDSGIDFFEALKQSGQCSSDLKIQKAIERVIPSIQNGANLNQVFQQEKVFPLELVTAISLGSQSGKLPEFLLRYADGLKKENESTIQTWVRFFPVLLYWLVIGQIVYGIVTFYMGYLDQALKIAP